MLLQSKAAEFLKSYRDSGADDIPVGPVDRLPTSLSLACGEEIPAADLELWLEQLAVDPWARGLVWRDEPQPNRLQEFSVVVIGAGGGGLGAAVYLERAGVPYVVIEKNAGVGGTWFENRYPGARVDTPSRAYTHTFGAGFEYPNPFCAQSENEKYFNWIADEFGVRGNIEFETEVKSVIWDEDAKVWEITAVGPDGPRNWRANAVISGVGFLARPNLPNIEGLAAFEGPAVPHRPMAERSGPHRQARRGDRQRVHQLPDDPGARRDGGPHLSLPTHPQLVLRCPRLSVAVPAASELAGSEPPVLQELRPVPDVLAVRPGEVGCCLHCRPGVQGHACEKRHEQAGS